MSITNYEDWELEDFAQQMPLRGKSRAQHRASKHKRGHQAKVSQAQALAATADEVDRLIDFNPTYLQNFDPKHHEYNWLMDSLAGFYADKVIDDVLGIVKAGKEANVYTCTGTSASSHALVAAKLYRPRMLRHLRNDAVYKQGRMVQDQDGSEVKGGRLARALKKKTRYGQTVDFASWILHEFQMQRMLYEAGADVPEPIAQRGNTILMAYIGDEEGAAQTLIDTTLDPDDAPALFEAILENIELMLAHHYVHGDLSAYNILYHHGRVTIIDFPQLADARVNHHAFTLLERDVLRVCQYFGQYGVESDPAYLAADLWQRWRDGLL